MKIIFIFFTFVLWASCQKEKHQEAPNQPMTNAPNQAMTDSIKAMTDSIKAMTDTVQTMPNCFAGTTGNNYRYLAGCRDMRIYTVLDTFRMVDIYLNEKNLDLQTTCKSFNIADYPSDIDINYFSYAHAKDSFYYNDCDGIPPYMGYRVNWKAVSGTVTVVVSKPFKYRTDNELFGFSLQLAGVKFLRENSTQDTIIQSLNLKDDSVGYLTSFYH